MRAVLRRIRYSIFTVLFVLFLSTSMLVFALENFTREDNLKEYMNQHIDIPNHYDQVQTICEHSETAKIPYEGQEIVIQCGELESIKKEEFPSYLLTTHLFSKIYEKNYPCTFIQCLQDAKTRSVVTSRQGNYFLNNIKIFMALGTIILGLIVVILSRRISQALTNIGYAATVVGAGYYFSPQLHKVLNVGIETDISALKYFLQPIMLASLIILILGLVLVIAGIVVGFIKRENLICRILQKRNKIILTDKD